jgi:hypothetical protein
MARKHIERFTKEAGRKILLVKNDLIKVATAFSMEEYDAEVMAGFLAVHSPLDIAVQNLDTALAMWGNNTLPKVLGEYAEEKKQYQQVLKSLENDKSSNAEQTVLNIINALDTLNSMMEYLGLVKRLGGLPNRNSKYNRVVIKDTSQSYEYLTKQLLQPIEKCIENIKQFIKEEIE